MKRKGAIFILLLAVICSFMVMNNHTYAEEKEKVQEFQVLQDSGGNDSKYENGTLKVIEEGTLDKGQFKSVCSKLKNEGLKKIVFEKNITFPEPLESGSSESLFTSYTINNTYVDNFARFNNLESVIFNGNVRFPVDSSYLFAYANCEVIFGEKCEVDTSKVTDMASMFKEVGENFSIDLSKFDTSNVENMCGLFRQAAARIGSVDSKINVSKFKTDKVEDMSFMFAGAKITKLDLRGWKTSNVTNMSFMFNLASPVTDISLNNFKDDSVEDVSNIFNCIGKGNIIDLRGWNINEKANMKSMFDGTLMGTVNLSNWNMEKSGKKSILHMFQCAKIADLYLNNWDTSNINDMFHMLEYGTICNIYLSGNNVDNLTTNKNVFECSKIGTFTVDTFVTNYEVLKKIKDCDIDFGNCKRIYIFNKDNKLIMDNDGKSLIFEGDNNFKSENGKKYLEVENIITKLDNTDYKDKKTDRIIIKPVYKVTIQDECNPEYTVDVGKGDKVKLLKKLEKEGYELKGWIAKKGETKKDFNINDPINDDITLIARWEKKDELSNSRGKGKKHRENNKDIELVNNASDVINEKETMLLNNKDRKNYLLGYEGNLIKPEKNITRAETATMFFRLLNDDVREKNLSDNKTFNDVAEDSWYSKSVGTMANLGIVKGMNDKEFNPDGNITRAEFAAVVSRFNNDRSSKANIFTDTKGHWAEDHIANVADRGWIAGYPDGTFSPDSEITRAEAVTIINKMLERLPKNERVLLKGMNKWKDNKDKNAWYYLAVQAASNSYTYEKYGKYEKWIKILPNVNWAKFQ